jgi:hypothetical protein
MSSKKYEIVMLQKVQHSIRLTEDQAAEQRRRNVVLNLSEGRVLRVPDELPAAEAEKLIGYGFAEKRK